MIKKIPTAAIQSPAMTPCIDQYAAKMQQNRQIGT